MRTFGKVSLAILLMAVLAWASDPWKSKPYQDWDQKDITKILNDSPWVKTITVTARWTEGNTSMGVPNDSQQRGGVAVGHPNMGGPEPNMTGGLPGGNSPGQGMRRQPEASFEARWVSAKTMRKALARMEVLNGKIQQPEAERYIAQTPPEYAIIVFGRDMTPFSKLEEASIVKNSYLKMKNSKQQIAPASVKLQRKGGRLMAVTFLFPKTANGKPTIAPNEKSIDLVYRFERATLKFHFDPRKMKTKQGPDL